MDLQYYILQLTSQVQFGRISAIRAIIIKIINCMIWMIWIMKYNRISSYFELLHSSMKTTKDSKSLFKQIVHSLINKLI